MTYTLKHKPLPGALVMAEYECLVPQHDDCGRFSSLVRRDENSEPPEVVSCEACSGAAGLRISAPHPKVDSVPCTAVVRGGDMKDSDRPPGMLSTRELADGMSYTDWKKKQKGITEERRHQQLIKAGLKSKKIQVG